MARNIVTSLRGYAKWVRQLPQATGVMFAARTVTGRSVKIFLFSVGVVLPLGSLIWVLLFLHGRRIRQQRFAGLGIAPTCG